MSGKKKTNKKYDRLTKPDMLSGFVFLCLKEDKTGSEKQVEAP